MEKYDVLQKVDHTLLKQEATWDDIVKLIDDAITYNAYSVCIAPCFVEQAKYYANGNLAICTVIGFPNGNMTTETKCFEAQDAIDKGADEIDMVINIGDVKAGNFKKVELEIKKIAILCHELRPEHKQIVLKVIIETCLLTELEVRKMCEIVKSAGADFIKTSTGFSTSGATFDNVKIMKEEIDSLGGGLKIKAAGGISNFDDAEKFIELGASRLGTSRLVNLMKLDK